MMIRTPVTSRAHWMKLRAECVITASTVAALFGVHPYESAYGCYMRAIGEGAEAEETRPMQTGNAAEFMVPYLVSIERPGLALTKSTDFYRHPNHPFGGTPDFFDQNGGCWQAKSVNSFSFARDWIDSPPIHVLIQHQAELHLSKALTGGIVAVVRDGDFTTRLYDVPAHAETQMKILQAVADFARRVELREPPPMDFAKDGDYIRKKYNLANKEVALDMSADNRLPVVCAERIAAAADEKDAVSRKEKATAEILTIIGFSRAVTTQGYSISAPTIASEEKIIPEHVKKASAYRRLTIKEI